MYPRLPELAARLLEKKEEEGARVLLKSAVEHNRNTYENLQKLMCGTIEAFQKRRPFWAGEREKYDAYVAAQILSEFKCGDGYVLYRDPVRMRALSRSVPNAGGCRGGRRDDGS